MAKALICMSNQRSFGQGQAVYFADNDGWIAGPNTSGLDLETGRAYGGRADSPFQDWDYISPVMGEALSLSKDRLQKYVDFSEHQFRCPSNETRYKQRYRGPALPTSGHPILLSYLTPAMMHLVPTGSRAQFRNTAEHNVTFGNWRLPRSYVPRVDQVGPASAKVAAFEGARYWYAAINGYDYSTVTNSSGLTGSPQGNFASRGPAFRGQGEPYTFRSGSPGNRKPGARLIEGGFRHDEKSHHTYYDGHVEPLNLTQASDPRGLVPTGTIVIDPSLAIDGAYHGIYRGYTVE